MYGGFHERRRGGTPGGKRWTAACCVEDPTRADCLTCLTRFTCAEGAADRRALWRALAREGWRLIFSSDGRLLKVYCPDCAAAEGGAGSVNLDGQPYDFEAGVVRDGSSAPEAS